MNINTKINNCKLCGDLVEKFVHNETIFYGKNNDILLLGEAPANNGWRKSKMLWKDINGKVLPSGVILQKLFDSLNINLFDLTFTEAVKCYPKERKNLKICSKNCHEFLIEQIKELDPKVIIPFLLCKLNN